MDTASQPHTRVTEFTIDRKTWLRGMNTDESVLLDGDGRQCCLGFYSSACGVASSGIAGRSFPSSIRPRLQEMSWLFEWDHETTEGAIEDTLTTVNDRSTIEDSEREETITRYFADQGITVNFIN